MIYNMEQKVVKCNGCGQYFMLTEKVTKCPFCKTEYVEIGEKVNDKKEAPRTQKKSFEIWKDS